MTMKPLQVQNISGLQTPTIGLQSPTLPAAVGAAQIDINSIMNLMLIMVVMVMMMKMMGQVTKGM